MPNLKPIPAAQANQKPVITRIDFFTTATVVVVNKYSAGWESENSAIHLEEGKRHPVELFDIDTSLQWCEDHGFIVRRWPGGARAFKDQIHPVRDALQIKKMRDELRKYPRAELQGQAWALDLAFDL